MSLEFKRLVLLCRTLVVFQTVMQVSVPRHYSRWLRHHVPSIVTKLPSLKYTKGAELTSLLLREADNESVASLLLEVQFDNLVMHVYCNFEGGNCFRYPVLQALLSLMLQFFS